MISLELKVAKPAATPRFNMPFELGFGEARHWQQPFAPQTLADFRQRGPLSVRQPQIPRRM
jgi:hypothetical protein